MSLLHQDRLFSSDPRRRDIARDLYREIKGLPIFSPHGHCDPEWFATNAPFDNPAALLITPDHYVLRMLVSQGVTYEALGVGAGTDPREIWRTFAAHYHLFLGTPSRLWLDYTFEVLFGLAEPLSPATADAQYDHIAACLGRDAFRPRALFDQFGIACLATTDAATDELRQHAAIQASNWDGAVIPTYRPDAVTDGDNPNFANDLNSFQAIADVDISTFGGYLEAHRVMRARFRALGAVATDHGLPDAKTLDLSMPEMEALYATLRVDPKPETSAKFRAAMVTWQARLAQEDGMVMQLHAGSTRNHNAQVFARHGADKGFDIPRSINFVDDLRPLLNAVGNDPALRIIVFTLDETTYSRELAPLSGAYPALRLGPPWWFFDSPDGIKRWREAVTETAGYYNTVGFNDDTRAFPSVPARHDMARRCDCAHLAERVADHRLTEPQAHEIARLLTYDLPRQTYALSVPCG